MRMRWVYLGVAVPTITEWLEEGRFPETPRESITVVVLTLLMTAGAWLICRQTDRLAALAETDPLTGLLNLRRLFADLDQEVARAGRLKTRLSLVYIDLDGFKSINDRFGHGEGDLVLARFSAQLRQVIRGKVDRAYRVAGDEFVLILPGTGVDGAAEAVHRLKERSREVFERYGTGFSAGIADLAAGENGADLLKRADGLMYQEKRASRGAA